MTSPQGMTIHGGALYVANFYPPHQSIQRFNHGREHGQFVASPSIAYPIERESREQPPLRAVLSGQTRSVDLTTMQSHGLLFPPGSGGI